MKKFIITITCILSMLGGFGNVKASSDDFTLVKDEAAFDNCIQTEKMCRLDADLTVAGRKEIVGDTIIDLNGHVITPDSNLRLTSGLIMVNRNSKLVINDTKGTGKISTGNSGNVWGAVQLIKNNDSNGLAELIVNGGNLEGYYYGVVGNGTLHNTKVTINGGNIKALNTEDSAGIYQPQEGELIINGGEISGGTGIEIRSGSLVVNDGTVKGLASRFVKVVNNNGTTTNGVGIAVAQHTTKKPVKVDIHKGNVQGQYAFYEWNPHGNNSEAINKVDLHIYGGNFEGYADGVSTVYSEDFTNFISGGTFNKNVDRYLTADATVFNPKNNSVDDKKSNKTPLLITLFVVLATGIAFYLFLEKKKNKIL